MKTILYDTETTGLKYPRLIQIAYKVGPDEIEQKFFKPAVPIEFGAMATHHITEEDLADKPKFSEEDRNMYLKLFQENIPVAHNLEFDIDVMRNEGVIISGGICTLKVARKILPDQEQYKMQYLRYSLGLEVDRDAAAHDAKGDVIVLDALFKFLFKEVEKQVPTAEVLNKMIEITNQPSLITRFCFGKHSGKNIKDIVISNYGYIEWLLKQSTLDKDLRYSLNYFVKNK